MTINYSQLIKVYNKLLKYNKVRFVIIGGVGFGVNYVMLTLLYKILRLPIIPSEAISIELSVVSTFLGNNFWTFSGHDHVSLKRKFAKFQVSALVGIVVNSVSVIVLVHYAKLYYGLALMVGTLLGMVWNYTAYNKFVFKTQD